VPHRHAHLLGTHWLHTSPGYWRIELAEGLKVRSTSSSKAQDMACARLGGEKLHSVHISPETGRTVLRFDQGGTISVAARGELDDEFDELWELHAPRNRFVTVHAHGQFRVGSSRTADCPKQALTLRSDEPDFIRVGRSQG
jgi:hypothetical protein